MSFKAILEPVRNCCKLALTCFKLVLGLSPPKQQTHKTLDPFRLYEKPFPPVSTPCGAECRVCVPRQRWPEPYQRSVAYRPECFASRSEVRVCPNGVGRSRYIFTNKVKPFQAKDWHPRNSSNLQRSSSRFELAVLTPAEAKFRPTSKI